MLPSHSFLQSRDIEGASRRTAQESADYEIGSNPSNRREVADASTQSDLPICPPSPRAQARQHMHRTATLDSAIDPFLSSTPRAANDDPQEEEKSLICLPSPRPRARNFAGITPKSASSSSSLYPNRFATSQHHSRNLSLQHLTPEALSRFTPASRIRLAHSFADRDILSRLPHIVNWKKKSEHDLRVRVYNGLLKADVMRYVYDMPREVRIVEELQSKMIEGWERDKVVMLNSDLNAQRYGGQQQQRRRWDPEPTVGRGTPPIRRDENEIKGYELRQMWKWWKQMQQTREDGAWSWKKTMWRMYPQGIGEKWKRDRAVKKMMRKREMEWVKTGGMGGPGGMLETMGRRDSAVQGEERMDGLSENENGIERKKRGRKVDRRAILWRLLGDV